MKKILLVSAVFPPEPIVSARLSYDLAVALSEKNEVTIISPRPTRPFGFKYEKQFQNEKYKHFQLNSYTCPESKLLGRLRETYSFGKYSYNYIVDNYQNIDTIYVNTWPLIADLYTVKAACKYKIPLIIHVQDIYPESLTNKYSFLKLFLNFILLPIDKYILHNSTKIVAISDNMKNYLVSSRNVTKEKIYVIQNWQDENIFIKYSSKKFIQQKALFTFMYLGNIGPVAGIELLIKSFAMAKLPNCRLVIAGTGTMKVKLEEIALKYTNTTIEFWSVMDGKVQEVQSFSDVMLLPMKKGASSSSMPSKLPAYMFSKKPVIACVEENSDTAKAIRNSKSGWISPPENLSLLADFMKYVSNLNSMQLLKMGNNGYAYAIENFSKQKNLKKLLNLINKN